MEKRNNITLLVQGRYSTIFLNNIEEYSKIFNDIVISTWEDEKIEKIDGCLWVINKLPDLNDKFYNVANIYYQCCSILNGLNEIKTEFVLKHRTDEYYSNISEMINFFDERLLSINVFFRPLNYKPYHISDHLFMCKTENLRRGMLNLKNYLESADEYKILNKTLYSAEMLIAVFYLTSFNEYTLKILNEKYNNIDFVYDVMCKHFNILNVNKLKPYHISHNNLNKIYNNFKDEMSIDSINLLKK